MDKENSDIELIYQATSGDKEALEKIIELHQPLIHYMAKSIVQDKDMVNDIVQDSSLLIYRSLYQLRDPSRFKQWLSSVVFNTARRYIHNQKRDPLSLEVLKQADFRNEVNIADSIADPYEEVEKKFVEIAILDAVMQLSIKEREVVFLFYYLSYSIQEITDLLHITVSSVKSRLYKARKHLAIKLSFFNPVVEVTVKHERTKKMIPSDNNVSGFVDDQAAMYQYAIAEAPRLGQKYIGTEHLLLGIVHTKMSEVSRLLEKMNVSDKEVRQAITSGYGDPDAQENAGLTTSARQVLAVSWELAQRLEAPQMDCTYILFSFLQVAGCGALQILESLQTDIDALSAEVINLLLKSSHSKKIWQGNKNLLSDIFTLKMRNNGQGEEKRNEKPDYSLFDEYIKRQQKMIQQSPIQDRKEELEKLNEQVVRLKKIAEEYSVEPRFPSFSSSTAAILSLAEEEAKKYHARVSAVFLFLGFMHQDDRSFLTKSGLQHTFEILDINHQHIYDEISLHLKQNDIPVVYREGNARDNVYLSDWSDISIFAYEAAIRQRSSSVEPGHLFLGLLHYLNFTPVPGLEKFKEAFQEIESE